MVFIIHYLAIVIMTASAVFAQEFEQVNTTSPQTLENKTLTSPSISAPYISGTVTGTPTIPGATFPNPSVTGNVGGGATYVGPTITSPTISGNVGGSATYTSPTLTSPTLTTPTISNPTINGTIAGSPTITTPTLTTPTINNPVLNLPNYTRAGLPTPGTSGRLARVTDGVRGIWLDQGAQWFPLNGAVYSVQEFGAVGNDTADDTSAIQAAITAAESTGGTVWFPVGVYKITAMLTVKSNVCLRGSSMFTTALHNANTGGAIGVKFSDSTTSNQELRFGCLMDLRLYGNASSGDGIQIDNPYHFAIWRAYIDQHGGIGVDVQRGVGGSTYGQNVWIDQSWIQVNRKGGVRLANAGNIATITRSSINQNAYYGVYVDRWKQVSIEDDELAIYRYEALIAGHQAIPVVINGGSNIRVISNSFEDNGGNGATPNSHIRSGWDGDAQSAATNNTQRLSIDSNDFKSTSGGTEGALNHLALNYAQGVRVENNFFEKEAGYANTVNGISLGSDMLTNGGLALRANLWDSVDAKVTGASRPILWDDVPFGFASLNAPNAHGAKCTDAAQVLYWQRYDVDSNDNFQILCDGTVKMGQGSGAANAVIDAYGKAINIQATTFGDLGTPANGKVKYCSDCTIASPCAGAGTGAIAKRLNNIWVCN